MFTLVRLVLRFPANCCEFRHAPELREWRAIKCPVESFGHLAQVVPLCIVQKSADGQRWGQRCRRLIVVPLDRRLIVSSSLSMTTPPQTPQSAPPNGVCVPRCGVVYLKGQTFQFAWVECSGAAEVGTSSDIPRCKCARVQSKFVPSGSQMTSRI